MEVYDAALEATLVHELGRSTNVARERRLTATYHDRYEEKMERVDQACRDRLAGELGTTDGEIRF
jgi:hypothetical protein